MDGKVQNGEGTTTTEGPLCMVGTSNIQLLNVESIIQRLLEGIRTALVHYFITARGYPMLSKRQ